MRHRKKLNRYERQAENKLKVKAALTGKGLYEYRNRTKGDLNLAKPANNGVKEVPPGCTFIGDDYFMFMINETHEVSLVRTIEQPKEIVMEEKVLIVDQPDCITAEGKIEHVVVQQKEKPLNEETPKNNEDILLVDDACDMEGIEIILE
jgi:hypothetical protein